MSSLSGHSEHFEDFFEKNMLSSKQNISLVIFREDFKSVVWFYISASCFKIFQTFLKFWCYLALKYIFGIQNIFFLRENVIPKNFCSYTFFWLDASLLRYEGRAKRCDPHLFAPQWSFSMVKFQEYLISNISSFIR